MSKRSSTSTKACLYWVTTTDHDEDWFVLARSIHSAARFFEEYEGYDPRDAKASRVLAGVDLGSDRASPRFAQLKDLRRLGFLVLRARHQRVVQLGQSIFREGQMQAVIDKAYRHIDRERKKALAARGFEHSSDKSQTIH